MPERKDRIQNMRSKQKQNTKVNTVRAQEGPPFNQKPIETALPKAPKPQPKKQLKKARTVPRLPDGSVFTIVYDGEKTQWKGTLLIPGCPEFKRDHPGAIGMLIKLDKAYRLWLREQEEAKEGAKQP